MDDDRWIRSTPSLGSVALPGAGGVHVRFHVIALHELRDLVSRQGWFAAPDLIVMDKSGAPVDAASSSLEVWLASRSRTCAILPDDSDRLHTSVCEIDILGEDDRPWWYDVIVHFDREISYTLTVETPDGIEASLKENGLGYYYCPDLLIVDRIEKVGVGAIVKQLVADGIWNYGIRSVDPEDQ